MAGRLNQAFDITSVRLTLRSMVNKGYLTLEDLDTPSSGWRENAERFRRHHPKYQQPVYVNPLREPEVAEAISLSDPRDFTPVTGQTPALEPLSPLSEPSDDHRPPSDAEPLPF